MSKKHHFNNGEGGYIFVSHSHKDIKKVRTIRNFMEEQGFEPLCLYLKCLTDENEIDDLLKREIAAREWFVYIDSDNARKSKWVKQEREYIESFGNKKVLTIELDNETSLLEASERLMNSMRVFLSYSHYDRPIAKELYSLFIEKDLRVFFDDDLPINHEFSVLIESHIKEASKRGCFVLLITENSVKSSYILQELNEAVKNNVILLPVIIGENIKFSMELESLLTNIQYIKIDKHPSKEQLDRVAETVETILLKRFYE